MRPQFLNTGGKQANGEWSPTKTMLVTTLGCLVVVFLGWLLVESIDKDGYDRGYAAGRLHERNLREETAEWEMGRLREIVR